MCKEKKVPIKPPLTKLIDNILKTINIIVTICLTKKKSLPYSELKYIIRTV